MIIMPNIVNKWHLWLAKTQPARIDWMERNGSLIFFLGWVLMLVSAITIMTVFFGVVVRNEMLEKEYLNERLTLAEYDRDIYLATTIAQANYIENNCKPLPPTRMVLSQPLQVKLKPKPKCLKRNADKKCVKWRNK